MGIKFTVNKNLNQLFPALSNQLVALGTKFTLDVKADKCGNVNYISADTVNGLWVLKICEEYPSKVIGSYSAKDWDHRMFVNDNHPDVFKNIHPEDIDSITIGVNEFFEEDNEPWKKNSLLSYGAGFGDGARRNALIEKYSFTDCKPNEVYDRMKPIQEDRARKFFKLSDKVSVFFTYP
jgi:hypothetical protein